MRYLLATGILAALTLALAGAAFAHEVGDVQEVERDAFGTPPDASKEQKHAGDSVAFKELLETRPKSGMLVRFTDVRSRRAKSACSASVLPCCGHPRAMVARWRSIRARASAGSNADWVTSVAPWWMTA